MCTEHTQTQQTHTHVQYNAKHTNNTTFVVRNYKTLDKFYQQQIQQQGCISS